MSIDTVHTTKIIRTTYVVRWSERAATVSGMVEDLVQIPLSALLTEIDDHTDPDSGVSDIALTFVEEKPDAT